MFLIHLVEHFYALGLTTWGLVPRYHSPSGVPRWVSGYRPAPWGTVMKPICHMFLIHLVEHFCVLGLTTWSLGPRWQPPRGFQSKFPAIGPRWHPPSGLPRLVSGYRPTPGDSDETNMSHVNRPPSGTFLRPWFDHLRPIPSCHRPGGAEMGLGL